MTDKTKIAQLQAMVRLLLGEVDYTTGNCSPTDMVAAVLPKNIIEKAKQVLDQTK